jgi:cation:H+ antiporter
MDTITLVLFAAGLVLLVVGANLLVGGASSLATSMGISPLAIGLTVVSLGTSAPELAVMVQASLAGEAGVGVGNVVGSSVFNVLFILGLSAMIAPLIVSPELLKQDGPVMVGAAILLLILTLDRQLGRLDGLLLVAILIVYTVYLIRRDRTKPGAGDLAVAKPGRWPLQLGRVLAGLALLLLGSRWLVNGAVDLAQTLGLSPVIVGLTVVAVGTSLPEVAASVQATLQGERDLAVGNIVGSNIFNVLAVLGLAALVSPAAIPVPGSVVQFDVPIVIAVTVAGLLSFATGYRVTRVEGGFFLGFYVLYTFYLILEATDHGAFVWFRPVALVLATVGLAVLAVHLIGYRRGATR